MKVVGWSYPQMSLRSLPGTAAGLFPALRHQIREAMGTSIGRPRPL
jgi:hypothetical protein